jgi:broad-specificity NMP kinase
VLKGKLRQRSVQALLILVGLTGTGKTTTVNALQEAGLDFTLLPNRRAITDEFIIKHIQELDNKPVVPVTDRIERFAYTRRFRELYPGGMAEALQKLLIVNGQLPIVNEPRSPLHPFTPSPLLLFDGLRGKNEITHVINLLPEAKFLFLHAPDEVRVNRLLNRGDAFDKVENADEVEAKRAIVQAERENYDPDATLVALKSLASNRLIFADTTELTPEQIAQITIATLGR